MTTKLAETLVHAINEYAETDVEAELYDAYSGRGMYGRSTAGVETSRRISTGSLLKAVARAAAYGELDDEDVEDLGRLREDSLGLGIILY